MGRVFGYQTKQRSSVESDSLFASRVKLINLELWNGKRTFGTFSLYALVSFSIKKMVKKRLSGCLRSLFVFELTMFLGCF